MVLKKNLIDAIIKTYGNKLSQEQRAHLEKVITSDPNIPNLFHYQFHGEKKKNPIMLNLLTEMLNSKDESEKLLTSIIDSSKKDQANGGRPGGPNGKTNGNSGNVNATKGPTKGPPEDQANGGRPSGPNGNSGGPNGPGPNGPGPNGDTNGPPKGPEVNNTTNGKESDQTAHKIVDLLSAQWLLLLLLTVGCNLLFFGLKFSVSKLLVSLLLPFIFVASIICMHNWKINTPFQFSGDFIKNGFRRNSVLSFKKPGSLFVIFFFLLLAVLGAINNQHLANSNLNLVANEEKYASFEIDYQKMFEERNNFEENLKTTSKNNEELEIKLEDARKKSAEELENVRKKSAEELDDVKRKSAEELENVRKKSAEELDDVKRKSAEELENVKRKSEEFKKEKEKLEMKFEKCQEREKDMFNQYLGDLKICYKKPSAPNKKKDNTNNNS